MAAAEYRKHIIRLHLEPQLFAWCPRVDDKCAAEASKPHQMILGGVNMCIMR